jgi:hypothetical protein
MRQTRSCRVERIPGVNFRARYCGSSEGGFEIDIEHAETGESYGLVALRPTSRALGPGRVHGKCAYSIEWIEAHKRGVGTKLYELGFEAARRLGCTLASDTTRSPYAEAFWRKQERKGRAHCEAGGGRLPQPRVARSGEVFWSDDILERARSHSRKIAPGMTPAQRALALKHHAVQAIPEGLPRPKFHPELGRYRWPCHRYVLDLPAPRSLGALGRVKGWGRR